VGLLEAAGGDVNVAAGYILDGDDSVRPTQTPTPQTPAPSQIPKPSVAPVTRKPEPRAGITGFSDLAKDSDEAPKGNNKDVSWFTGGASSGIQVQAPHQERPDDIIARVFEQAKQHGAIAKADEKPEEKEKFSGSGFVLGNTAQLSRPINAAPKPQGRRRVILTLYKDCFTVDDGPPRKLTDPANKPFLDDVNNGVVPRELQALAGPGADVDVELIQKKSEEYKPPPKPAIVAFTGAGQALGGHIAGTRVTAKQIIVNESTPVTTLQIRLHDGQRLVLKVNHTHTVGDIRAHIEFAHSTGKGFELRTTFPPKVLSEDFVTVKDAGLLNAAIVQRLES